MGKIIIGLVMATGLLTATCYSLAGEDKRDRRRGPPPFSELDLNGDNSITLEEFQQHEVPHGDHSTIFSHIDANGDGMIDEDELKNHKPPRPPRRD